MRHFWVLSKKVFLILKMDMLKKNRCFSYLWGPQHEYVTQSHHKHLVTMEGHARIQEDFRKVMRELYHYPYDQLGNHENRWANTLSCYLSL